MWNGPMRIALACASAVILVAPGWSSALGSGLPDSRAYELVSPPAKHGVDVMGDPSRVRVASDGDAASFASLGGFGDVRGAGVGTDYVSERSSNPSPGTNGWATHAITPRQDPLTFLGVIRSLDSGWAGDFSPDLSAGVFSAWSPVTSEDPNVAHVENLYLRDDLRTPGAGHYRLLTPCPACGSPLIPQFILFPPQLVGTSGDFSHVVFESLLPLTPDASGSPNVYEWANGTLRLAGILPDNACGTPPCPAGGSTASASVGFGRHVISSDGSRITFTDTTTGQIYQRIDGSQTLAVSASERTDCADNAPCNGTPEPDPGGPQPATFQIASTDGTRVFFTTSEQLTNDDHNPSVDLYVWDATRPSGQRLTRVSVDHNPVGTQGDVVGVLGIGDSGHDAYFSANGSQLVSGKPDPADQGIYAWHDGTVAYVGNLDHPQTDGGLDYVDAGAVRAARVTPDGAHLLFVSHTGGGLLSAHGGVDIDQTHCADGCAEFYLYNAAGDTLACASCNPGGQSPTVSVDTFVRDGTGAATGSAHLGHSLSDDGRWVFFNTDDALVPGDANGKTDAYEYDAQSHDVRLLSSGTDPSNSFFMDASPDGRNAFILTRQQLVGWDTDSNYDLYDARIGGGFPDPVPPPLPCSGDGCRSPLGGSPSSPVVGSTAVGTGDRGTKTAVKPKPKVVKSRVVRCRKGSVRKRVHGKVKCVKQKRRLGGKQASRATVKRMAR